MGTIRIYSNRPKVEEVFHEICTTITRVFENEDIEIEYNHKHIIVTLRGLCFYISVSCIDMDNDRGKKADVVVFDEDVLGTMTPEEYEFYYYNMPQGTTRGYTITYEDFRNIGGIILMLQFLYQKEYLWSKSQKLQVETHKQLQESRGE